MASNLPKFSLLALLCAALLASPAPRAAAAARAQATTVTTNQTITLNAVEVNSCAGEVITLNGQIHTVTHVTLAPNGGRHTKMHQNFENVTGTGALSLTNYRAVSVNNHTFNNNGSNAQNETTNINRVRLISQGPGDNLLINASIHTTINANGEATSTVVRFEAVCTG